MATASAEQQEQAEERVAARKRQVDVGWHWDPTVDGQKGTHDSVVEVFYTTRFLVAFLRARYGFPFVPMQESMDKPQPTLPLSWWLFALTQAVEELQSLPVGVTARLTAEAKYFERETHIPFIAKHIDKAIAGELPMGNFASLVESIERKNKPQSDGWVRCLETSSGSYGCPDVSFDPISLISYCGARVRVLATKNQLYLFLGFTREFPGIGLHTATEERPYAFFANYAASYPRQG